MVRAMRHSFSYRALFVAVLTLLASCSEASPSRSGATEDAGEQASAPTGRIFASVSGAGEVVVLDGTSHEQLATIGVGKGPAILVGTHDRSKVYAANWGDNTVSVIDAESLSAKSLPMPGRPYVIAIAPDGKRLYAGCATTNEIVVIDVHTDEELSRFAMAELPASIVVSSDNATLYVAMLGTIPGAQPGTIMAISAESGDVKHPAIEVGSVPAWITMSPDGRRVYTLNFLSDDVSVVNTESWTVEATIDTGAGSQAIIGAVAPDGSALYVTNFGTAELMAIDTSNNQIKRTIKLDGKPVGVSFNADGSRVYVTDFGKTSLQQSPLVGLQYLLSGVYSGGGMGQVRVFDTSTGEAVGATASTGPGATSVVVREAPKAP